MPILQDEAATRAAGGGITPGLTLLFAATAGIAVANIYFAQPVAGLLIAAMGPGAGQVLTATQVGYALGLVLLVPLGDVVDRRRLILGQCAALVLATAWAALSPGLGSLMAASVLLGALSTIAQHAIPFAADLAGPARRGAVVGQVMSGLLAGILLGRAVGGAVGEHLGWRATFWVGTGLVAVLGAVLAWRLPSSRPAASVSYAQLLRSLPALLRRHPALLRASCVQGCLFAGFSAFWSSLSLLLEGPGFRMGSSVAGLFGVIGLAGVAVAPLAGRMSDRRGPWAVGLLGVVVVAAGYGVLGLAAGLSGAAGLLGLGLGVVVMDAGIQFAMISNQATIFALDEAARSRINTVFVVGIFVGGAVGSAGGGVAWLLAGWPGVIGFAGAFALAALALHLSGRGRDQSRRR